MYQPMTLPDLLFAAADRAGYVNSSGKLKRKELADASVSVSRRLTAT